MVEKIRELCKKQGTSLTKLEQQLGFGNGVIGRWNKSKPSYDRLEKVANALGVPVSYLTGEEQKEKHSTESEVLSDKEIALAKAKQMSKEDLWELFYEITEMLKK